jgi:signal transduction histidine kinase
MRLLRTLLLALPAFVLSAQTAKEAEAFVKAAVLFAKANPREAFINEVNKPTGQFNFATKKTLYISVYDLEGKVLGHGAKVNVVGVNQINAKDANGKLYVKARIDLAKEQGKGWVSYMEIDPATKKEEHKTSYIETFDGMVISCGIYQR